MNTEIAAVDPRSLRLLAINARSMPHETFQRLVANIAADGALTSTPLVAALGYYAVGDEAERDAAGTIIDEVLSGNHRVKAAIAAGLERIHVIRILDPLSREQRVAIQLAHNAIDGNDDPALLKQLYESLDIDWRRYAALDDKQLGEIQKVEIGALPSVTLDYQPLTFVFLPHEAERIAELFATARKTMPGDLYLVRWGEYDRLLDTLEDVGAAHAVRNGAGYHSRNRPENHRTIVLDRVDCGQIDPPERSTRGDPTGSAALSLCRGFMDKTATRRTPTFAEYLSTLHEQRRAARRAPTFAEYLSTLHEQRLKAITAEMPRAPLQQLPSRVQRTIAQVVARYASAATAHYGRRGLSRVVWPWTPRPGAETRAPRGRLSNPTALR